MSERILEELNSWRNPSVNRRYAVHSHDRMRKDRTDDGKALFMLLLANIFVTSAVLLVLLKSVHLF